MSGLRNAAFALAVLFPGGAVSQEPPSDCFGGGSVAGAAVGAFLAALLLVLIVVLLRRFYWRSRKGKHLVLVTDPENVKDEFAFDNPGFKSGERQHLENGRSAKDYAVGALSEPQWTHGGIDYRDSQSKRLQSRLVTQDDAALQQPRPLSHLVSLWSKDFTGLGLTVSGGSKDGIYVANVLRSGPAAASGLISTGDRINSVRISFRNMVLEDAMTILSYASPYEIQLEVETLRYPITWRTPNAIQVVHPVLGIGGTRRRRNSSSDFDSLEKSSKHRHFSASASPNSNDSTLEKSNNSKSGGIKKIITEKIITTTTLDKPKVTKEKKPDNWTVEKENEKNISKAIAAKKIDAVLSKKHSEISIQPPDSVYIETNELQKKESDVKKGMKFGIRVLPPNERISKESVNARMSIDEVDKSEDDRKLPEAPIVAKRREKPAAPTPNARNFIKVSSIADIETNRSTFERSSINSSIKRDENGIPQEIPKQMMDAALIARNSRKTEIEFDKAELDTMVADRTPKKSKGKAPSPPDRHHDTFVTSTPSKLEFSDNFVLYDSENMSTFLEKEKSHSSELLNSTLTAKHDYKQGKRLQGDVVQFTQDDIEDIVGRRFSKKESDSLNNYFEDTKSNLSSNIDGNSVMSLGNTSEIDKLSTAVELSSSSVTVHSSPVDTEDNLENERKAASLGDLSRFDKIKLTSVSQSQGTLERAQSLDISADDDNPTEKVITPKKRKANSVIDSNFYGNINTVVPIDISTVEKSSVQSKEPRLSLNIATLSTLEGLNTFQRNRLKKASEFGNLEDAIFQDSNGSDLSLKGSDVNLEKVNNQETYVTTTTYSLKSSTDSQNEKTSPKAEHFDIHTTMSTFKEKDPPLLKVKSRGSYTESEDQNMFIPISELPKLTLEERISINYDTNVPDDLKATRHTLVSNLEKPKSDMMKKLLAQNPVLQTVHLDKGTVKSSEIFDTTKVTEDTPLFKFVSHSGAVESNKAQHITSPKTPDTASDSNLLTFIGKPEEDKPKVIERVITSTQTFDISNVTKDSPLLKFVTKPDIIDQNIKVSKSTLQTLDKDKGPDIAEQGMKVSSNITQVNTRVTGSSTTTTHESKSSKFINEPEDDEFSIKYKPTLVFDSSTLTKDTSARKRVSSPSILDQNLKQRTEYKKEEPLAPRVSDYVSSININSDKMEQRATVFDSKVSFADKKAENLDLITSNPRKNIVTISTEGSQPSSIVTFEMEEIPSSSVETFTKTITINEVKNVPDILTKKALSGASLEKLQSFVEDSKSNSGYNLRENLQHNVGVLSSDPRILKETTQRNVDMASNAAHNLKNISQHNVGVSSNVTYNLKGNLQHNVDTLSSDAHILKETTQRNFDTVSNAAHNLKDISQHNIGVSSNTSYNLKGNLEHNVGALSSDAHILKEITQRNIDTTSNAAHNLKENLERNAGALSSDAHILKEITQRNADTTSNAAHNLKDISKHNIVVSSNATYNLKGNLERNVGALSSDAHILKETTQRNIDTTSNAAHNLKGNLERNAGALSSDAHILKEITQRNIDTTSNATHNLKGNLERNAGALSSDDHILKEITHRNIDTTSNAAYNFKGNLERNAGALLSDAHILKEITQRNVDTTSNAAHTFKDLSQHVGIPSNATFNLKENAKYNTDGSLNTAYNLKTSGRYNVKVSSEDLPVHKTVTVNMAEDEHGNRIITQNVEQINTRTYTVRTEAPIEVEQITYGLIRNPTDLERLSIEDSEKIKAIDSKILKQIESQNPNVRFTSESPAYSKTETVIFDANLNEADALALMNRIKSEQSTAGTVISGEVRRDTSTDRIEMKQTTYKINKGFIAGDDTSKKIKNIDRVYNEPPQTANRNTKIIKSVSESEESSSKSDSGNFVTEIQVVTPRTERNKKEIYNYSLSPTDSISLSYEIDKSLLYDFLYNERMHSAVEKLSQSRTNGAKRTSDEDLPRNSHIKFRTATYETRNESPEKTRSQIEILRWNFERGESLSPPPTGSAKPSVAARPSSIPIKLPEKSKDGQRSNSTSPSKIPVMFGQRSLSQESLTDRSLSIARTSPTANAPAVAGNITVTSIKSSSRNPSGK